LLSENHTRKLSVLYSAVLCDALDHLGFRKQGLSSAIRPLYPEARFVGTARTMLSVRKPRLPEKPYQMELEALDSLQPGDVVVFDTGDDCSAGVWGELLSTAARAKGARGAVIDGLTRDAARICAMGFPVYARGISPYDSCGRSEVIAYDVPVQCGGVTVKSGEIVFADYDGVIVIPQDALASALEFAETKASRERIVDEEFRKGRKVAEVFAKHGVL
jgi:4-hydroxy-4-methyl-2-oxoglutarate aldolase